MSGLEQDFDFVAFQHSQHPPPSALLVFRARTEGDCYFFRRVLDLTEFPKLGVPEFSEPASRKRRGISTFRTASTTTTLTIVITFWKMQPPASLRSED